MKKILLFVLLMSLTIYTSAIAEPMKLAYYDKYAPRSFAENGKMKGIIIDVMNEVLQNRMGIEIVHNGYPWKRAQLLVKNGSADAFVTVPTAERREYTAVSKEPVLTFQTFVATFKGSKNFDKLSKIKSISELKGYNLIDYAGNGWAKKALKDLNVTWHPDYDSVFRLLNMGKADAVVVSRKSIHTIAKMSIRDQIVVFDNPLTSINFHLCINKDSEYVGILDDFDSALRKVKDEGFIENIIKSYY